MPLCGAMSDLLEAFACDTVYAGWLEPDLSLSLEETASCVGDGSAPLTYAALVPHFDKPLYKAASALGVGTTRLKIACRKIGLAHWPFRKLASVRRVDEVEAAAMVARGPPFSLSSGMAEAIGRACKARMIMRKEKENMRKAENMRKRRV